MNPSNFPFPFAENMPMEQMFTGPVIGVLISLAIFDLALKGWALWRAARMQKNIWFIALLVVNSIGILPIAFLIITSREYETLNAKGKTSVAKK
jgi:hypothetical protein